MFERKLPPATAAMGIVTLVLALGVLSGCGSTTIKTSDARAAEVEAEQNASEHAQLHVTVVHAPAPAPHGLVTSCTRLNATRSLCVCFQKKVDAHETPAQIAVIEYDLNNDVPLAASVTKYVEECPA